MSKAPFSPVEAGCQDKPRRKALLLCASLDFGRNFLMQTKGNFISIQSWEGQEKVILCPQNSIWLPIMFSFFFFLVHIFFFFFLFFFFDTERSVKSIGLMMELLLSFFQPFYLKFKKIYKILDIYNVRMHLFKTQQTCSFCWKENSYCMKEVMMGR